MQKDEEKICQQASKIKLFEASYGDSKNELQIMIAKRPQIEKVFQTFTGASFLFKRSAHSAEPGKGQRER